MKWWKKLLIAVGILAALGVGLMGYGIWKVSDVYEQKIQPDMQRYVQMTKEEQDEYVIAHMEDLLKSIQSDDTDDKVKLEYEAIEKDPAARQAAIEVGRSMCAVLLSASDDITSKLSAADKAKYEEEGKALDARGKAFDKAVEDYAAKKHQ
jgi:hypothetical protein